MDVDGGHFSDPDASNKISLNSSTHDISDNLLNPQKVKFHKFKWLIMTKNDVERLLAQLCSEN